MLWWRRLLFIWYFWAELCLYYLVTLAHRWFPLDVDWIRSCSYKHYRVTSCWRSPWRIEYFSTAGLFSRHVKLLQIGFVLGRVVSCLLIEEVLTTFQIVIWRAVFIVITEYRLLDMKLCDLLVPVWRSAVYLAAVYHERWKVGTCGKSIYLCHFKF